MKQLTLEEKDFTFEFEEFRYNNINQFIEDWGFRLAFIKEGEQSISIGKYLEENPNVTIRVSKDDFVNSYRFNSKSHTNK